jgi:hypothetical protein
VKLLIATQEEPFYLPIFLERFLGATDAQVVGAVVGAPFNGARDWLGVLINHWRWYGTPAFVAQGSRFAARKVIDRLRPQHQPPYSVRAVMERAGVPIWPMHGVNGPDFTERVRDEGVDLFVSVAYPRIVRMATLAAFPQGGINFHLGPLPRYRGLNPLFWCLLHREPASAVTVHRMAKALDSGPILAQEFFPLDDVVSLDAAYHRAIALGPGVLARVVQELASGTAQDQPNPADEGSYFGFPTAADGRSFRRMGRRFW